MRRGFSIQNQLVSPLALSLLYCPVGRQAERNLQSDARAVQIKEQSGQHGREREERYDMQCGSSQDSTSVINHWV